jgi:homoserine kinase type II
VAAAPADLTELLAQWGVPGDAEVSDTERGSNNGTLIVTHADRRWVLRISQNLSAVQVSAEHRLLARLRGADLPFQVPEPLRTRDGSTLVPAVAGPVTLCRWIPGVRADLTDEPALERFGQAIGTLIAPMRQVSPGDAPHNWHADQLLVHPDVPSVNDLCVELRAAGVRGERVTVLREAAGRVAKSLPAMADELPVQVIHGDFAASNVLVDEHTGRVTAVLDFEFAGTDFRVQDLVAGLLQSGALDGPRWQPRMAALVRGYLSAQRLDPAEAAALPDLLLWRSAGTVLWRAGRWRRGQAGLGEVTDRLDRLAETVRWLAENGAQLRAAAAAA